MKLICSHSSTLFLFSCILLLSGSLCAQIPMLDESYQDPSFLRFKMQLTEAVLDRNADALEPLLWDKLDLGFDSPPDAKEYLLKTLREGTWDGYWKELEDIMSMGFVKEKVDREMEIGAVSSTMFFAPSFHAPSIQRINGPGQHLLITGRDVNIREAPTTSAPVVRRASWEFFPYHSELMGDELAVGNLASDGYVWIELVLPSGELGYVVDLYSSTRFMADLMIMKLADGWKIVAFNHYPGC